MFNVAISRDKFLLLWGGGGNLNYLSIKHVTPSQDLVFKVHV